MAIQQVRNQIAILNCPCLHDQKRVRQVRLCIKALAKIGLQRIYVAYPQPENSKNCQLTQDCFIDLQGIFPDQKIVPVATANDNSIEHWRQGVLAAKCAETDVDSYFVLSCDIDKNPTPENIAGWEAMLDQGDRNSLVVGDFEYPTSFRIARDRQIIGPLLNILFPHQIDALTKLDISNYGTDYFVLGSDFHSKFENSYRNHWGNGRTIQLILYGLEDDALNVKSVHFGCFHGVDVPREHTTELLQVVQTLLHLTLDRIERLERRDDSQHAHRSLLNGIRRALYQTLGTNSSPPTIDLTNSKINRFHVKPVWEIFCGYSIVCNNLAETLRPGQNINTQMTELPTFYNRLWETLEHIDSEVLISEYLVAFLPVISAHCTLFDGVNQENTYQSITDKMLEDRVMTEIANRSTLILSEGEAAQYFKWVVESQAYRDMQIPIRFRFDKFAVFGNQALVALLKVVNEDRKALKKIESARTELNKIALKALGFAPSFSDWSPHITIGYFANQDAGARARDHLSEWTNIATSKLENLEISYEGASLYGFTAMDDFFKL